MRYRRAIVPGGTYFFTLNLADRDSALLVSHIDHLRQAFKQVKQRHPFAIDAIVVLPDHLHALWTLPQGDADFAGRWQLIKAHFSRALPVSEYRNGARRNKRERGIWQRRYWEHLIRNDADFRRHLDYIHYNPVKHGHAATPIDWPHSSIHHHIRRGTVPPDWAATTTQGSGLLHSGWAEE